MTSRDSSLTMGDTVQGIARSSVAAILPDGVQCAEQAGLLHGSLLPTEAALLSDGAVKKRRDEFTAGRTCARQALASLGIPAAPILQGAHREPLWPQGVVGSITHCQNYCAAVVAPTTIYRSIGIDAELNEPLPSDVLRYVAREPERAWIVRTEVSGICWDRLLFSIKESVYKVWYPLEQCWLDFDEAEIEIDPATQTFQARILRPTSTCPSVLHGTFAATPSHLFTCVSVRRIS